MSGTPLKPNDSAARADYGRSSDPDDAGALVTFVRPDSPAFDAGIECGMDTVLVLSGVTSRATIGHFPYRPRLILNGVGDIPAAAEAQAELTLLKHAAG